MGTPDGHNCAEAVAGLVGGGRGEVLVDVALFSNYRIVYQKGVMGIFCENYKVTFKYLKELIKFFLK